LFVIVAQITIHALPYFDIENTTTVMIKGMLLLLVVVVVGAATPPLRTNGMTTTTTARPTTTLATVDRYENPYLKMQALLPTPRQREFGIVLVIFCFVPPDMNHTVLTGSNWWWIVDGRRLASNTNDGIVFRPLSSKFNAKLEYVSPEERRVQLWESQNQWIDR
jgi:hypothetical protein